MIGTNFKEKMRLLLLLIFMAPTLVSWAQTSGGGLKAGLNFSKFNRSASESRIGLHVGGYYQQMVHEQFGLVPEALLSLEGDDNTSFTNLNIAIGLRYFFIKELSAELVPQLGFVLGDENTNAKSLNFSIGLGAMYQLNAKVGLGARYYSGLTNLYEPVNAPNIKNNTFQLSSYIKL